MLRSRAGARRDDIGALSPVLGRRGGLDADSAQKHDDLKAEFEVQSSLPLQVTLYLNKFFYVFYVVTIVIISGTNETKGGFFGSSPFERILYVFVFVFEPFRLSMGYIGNLNERIAVLAGFGMVNLILIFPSVAYLMAASPSPIELLLNAIQACFLIGQFAITYRAVNNMSKTESAHHHLLGLLGFHDADDSEPFSVGRDHHGHYVDESTL